MTKFSFLLLITLLLILSGGFYQSVQAQTLEEIQNQTQALEDQFTVISNIATGTLINQELSIIQAMIAYLRVQFRGIVMQLFNYCSTSSSGSNQQQWYQVIPTGAQLGGTGIFP